MTNTESIQHKIFGLSKTRSIKHLFIGRMTDVDIIKAFGGYHALFDLLPVDSRPTYVGVHKWGYHGIPARWRPTIWALLEQRCPEVAAKLNRDEFLGVRLPLPSSREDAA